MTINYLEEKMKELENSHEDIKFVIVDDYNSEEAVIFIHLLEDYREKPNKRKMTALIKRFFRINFNYKLYLNYDKNNSCYEFDFPYVYYNQISKPCKRKEKDTLVFSKKAYQEDKEFAKIVMETSYTSKNKKEHLNKIQLYYPNYTVIPYYTFEHSQALFLEEKPSCNFDSVGDSFVAYKNRDKMEKRIEEINENIGS